MPISSTISNSNDASSYLLKLAPLEAILFDIDGTICDSDPLHHLAFREMLLEIGYNNGVPIDEEFFIKNIAGRHNDDIGNILFPDWDREKANKFLDDKEALFRRLAPKELKAIDALHKLCEWVKERGLKRAAVTNAPRPNAELMISTLGLADFFQVVVVGSECTRAKPSPDPYLKALEELKASAKHSFVFEDSPSGIKAGVAAGMPVIALQFRNPAEQLLDAGATFLIKDYADSKLWKELEEVDQVEKKTQVEIINSDQLLEALKEYELVLEIINPDEVEEVLKETKVLEIINSDQVKKTEVLNKTEIEIETP